MEQTEGRAQKISHAILSTIAGVASFLFSLTAFLYITEFAEQILASIVAGAFCLLQYTFRQTIGMIAFNHH